MSRTFTGRDVASALMSMNYAPVDRTGSHLKLRWEAPHGDEVRVVTVPMHDEIPTGTLRSIADQCGAGDFHAWCAWIDEHS
ncbi:MAG: type II toxin-antitoxin system HicA family toxin [Halarchaeum sp.]